MCQSPKFLSLPETSAEFQTVYLTSPLMCLIYITNVTGPKLNSCSSLNLLQLQPFLSQLWQFQPSTYQANKLRFPLDSLPLFLTHIHTVWNSCFTFKIFPGSDNFSPFPLFLSQSNHHYVLSRLLLQTSNWYC